MFLFLVRAVCKNICSCADCLILIIVICCLQECCIIAIFISLAFSSSIIGLLLLLLRFRVSFLFASLGIILFRSLLGNISTVRSGCILLIIIYCLQECCRF